MRSRILGDTCRKQSYLPLHILYQIQIKLHLNYANMQIYYRTIRSRPFLLKDILYGKLQGEAFYIDKIVTQRKIRNGRNRRKIVKTKKSQRADSWSRGWKTHRKQVIFVLTTRNQTGSTPGRQTAHQLEVDLVACLLGPNFSDGPQVPPLPAHENPNGRLCGSSTSRPSFSGSELRVDVLITHVSILLTLSLLCRVEHCVIPH